jgi:DNA transformation protein
MFGGWGISTEGLNVAIVADLGLGETLWLKADAVSLATFEAAGCARFTYQAKGKPVSVNYYSAPQDALESVDQMRPWAELAMEAALRAAAKRVKVGKAKKTVKKSDKKTANETARSRSRS